MSDVVKELFFRTVKIDAISMYIMVRARKFRPRAPTNFKVGDRLDVLYIARDGVASVHLEGSNIADNVELWAARRGDR